MKTSDTYLQRHNLVKGFFAQLCRYVLAQVRPPASTVETMADNHRTQVEEARVKRHRQCSEWLETTATCDQVTYLDGITVGSCLNESVIQVLALSS
jgi:hypothetical protein